VVHVFDVSFGQEGPTEQFRSMRFFYDSVFLITVQCSSPSEHFSARSFCESILFLHLKALRGGELLLVRTVGMVGLNN